MAKRKHPAPEEPTPNAQAEAAEVPPAPAEEPALPAEGPTLRERRAAAVAHGSVLLNLLTGIGGPVVALVVWLYNEHKSEYVGWHALQALVFQGIFLLLTLVLGGITALLWFLTVPLLRATFAYAGICLIPFTLGFTLITAAVVIGSLIYGAAGAMAVLEGEDFRYRWVSELIPPLTRP